MSGHIASGAVIGAAMAAASTQGEQGTGTLVQVDEENFLMVLAMNTDPLVVHAFHRGFFGVGKSHRYVSVYRGFVFVHQASQPLECPEHAIVIEAKSIPAISWAG